MRILTAFKQDLKFQFRHKFYHAYLIVSIIYIALLLSLPGDLRPFIAGIIIFSDPAMLGFFFISAIILLEKGDRILESLFVTPLKLEEYIIAKLISLGVLSLLTSLLIVLITIGNKVNYLLLIIGVILTAATFTLFGLAITAWIKTVNQFLIVSTLFSMIAVLPVIGYLGLADSRLFYLWPSQPALLMIGGALNGGISNYHLIYSLIASGIWLYLGLNWSRSWFYKYIILKIGDK